MYVVLKCIRIVLEPVLSTWKLRCVCTQRTHFPLKSVLLLFCKVQYFLCTVCCNIINFLFTVPSVYIVLCALCHVRYSFMAVDVLPATLQSYLEASIFFSIPLLSVLRIHFTSSFPEVAGHWLGFWDCVASARPLYFSCFFTRSRGLLNYVS